MLYPCWDSFKTRCGKHTDHFMTWWLGHLHGIEKRTLPVKEAEFLPHPGCMLEFIEKKGIIVCILILAFCYEVPKKKL